MQNTGGKLPLSGVVVVEIAGGAAAAYCGRLLRDAGATVIVSCASERVRYSGIVRADHPLEYAYAQYLHAGKEHHRQAKDGRATEVLCSEADLVIVGEESGVDASGLDARVAIVGLTWFGQTGAYSRWRGSDLVIQALTGMTHLNGPVDGPPLGAGDRQATAIGGVTAYISALAALLSQLTEPREVQRLEVSILEANMALSEMHMAACSRDGKPMARAGINRYEPMCPVGVYACREGWVGITITTPDQWRLLCDALDLHEFTGDPLMMTREQRFPRIDDVEAGIERALAARPAAEWAAIALVKKIPMVLVPDAAGILAHEVFAARGSLASVNIGGRELRVPRTPFGLERTPLRAKLDAADVADTGPSPFAGATPAARNGAAARAPLEGLKVVDFAMGWAGPLASRLLSDLGAEVIKIEAGRYPDWWRATNWTPEFIEGREYEKSALFITMNRGKKGVSIDLTTDAGRQVALGLVATADAVVENQASGVMKKFGLDWPALSGVRPGLVMLSMSAFGSGNALSATRAYGSTLEQASGLPSFLGEPKAVPTMVHQAHGDPVGGIYGAAALLTALVHRRLSGEGQFVNLSIVETVLQLTTPGLLEYQLSGFTTRRGNASQGFVLQGIYRARGEDCWLAVSVADAAGLAALRATLGSAAPKQTHPAGQQNGARRSAWEPADALSDWVRTQSAMEAAEELQRAGIAAAPVLPVHEVSRDRHLVAAGFFVDVERGISGLQRHASTAIRRDGQRLGSPLPAPLLGEHTEAVLGAHLGMSSDQFKSLVDQEVVTFIPRPVKNLVKAHP